MDLTARPTPGQWARPQWPSERPGTYAFVAGVSRYEFLSGGATPAPDTYELGQLYVSALSAYRFFEWLNERYDYPEAPLVLCWLLLAPTASELALEPGLARNALLPTYDHLRTSLVAWRRTLAALPPATAAASRSFFLFSGHGIELDAEIQVLLPSDYLDPAYDSLSRALSGDNLWQGLGTTGVRDQFFFIDACRNGNEVARLRAMPTFGGESVFDPVRGSARKRCAPKFYAAGPGTQSWQPKTPDEGTSIFVQAVLEGLNAEGGFVPDCAQPPLPPPCRVKMFELQNYVGPRVAQLLAANPPVAPDPSMLGGSFPGNVTITHVPPVTALGTVGPPPPARATLEALVSDSVPIADRRPGLGGMGIAAPHQLFGHESVTAIWQSARLFDLEHREWQKGDAYVIHEFERNVELRMYRIVLSVSLSGPGWLEFTDGSLSFACVLAGDLQRPRYELVLNVATTGPSWPPPIISLTASLASDAPGPLADAARLWLRYRATSAAGAAQSFSQHEFRELELILMGKVDSPLAATVAGIVLLRAGQYDLLHENWLANLANWFGDRPDGPVLRAEQLLAQQGPDPSPEALMMFLELGRRGLPLTTDALAFARKQGHLFMESPLPPPQHLLVAAIDAALDRALRLSRSGGLFATFAAPRGTLNPTLLQVAP